MPAARGARVSPTPLPRRSISARIRWAAPGSGAIPSFPLALVGAPVHPQPCCSRTQGLALSTAADSRLSTRVVAARRALQPLARRAPARLGPRGLR